MKQCCLVVLACSLLLASGQASFCQAPTSDTQPPQKATASSAPAVPEGKRAMGLGVKVSTLGVGVEVAARITHRANVRAGFNVLGYSRNFNKDGIGYDGHLSFKTVEGHFDLFPWAGKFHVGPGILAYLGDPITARAAIRAGQSFTLGGTTFFSDTTTPTNGSGKIDFNRAAPTVTFGRGNLVPRSYGHFSVPVEFGVAFQGSPQATLHLVGNVCAFPGTDCRSVASDPTVQSHILSEQNKLNNSMSFFKVYPIVSLGFGYSF